MSTSPHGLRPALRYRGLRFPRTAGEAFRDAYYASAIERPAPRTSSRLLVAGGFLGLALWSALCWGLTQ